MAAATSLVFNIIGNNQASAALSAVGGAVDDIGDKVKKWGLVAAAGVAAVGVAAVSFGVSAVNAASDLNETLSKSAAIFGDQADDIAAWGDTAAKTMGLSKAAALAAAAGFGDMFTQLGFGGDVAADMSKDVVQMAADLGSFNNLGTDDVADRLSAAFRGEYDSLQALIPNINAARVEQEAMAASGKTNASELTAQEKAAAVLAIVHADGARAAGDFAKTSNGLANQQKILSASFEDVKAKAGTALLPVLTKLGTFAIDKLLPGLQSLAQTVTGFLGPAFDGLTAGFIENDVTSTGLFGTFEKLGVQLRAVATWVQGTLVPTLQGLWSTVQSQLLPALQGVGSFIMSTLLPAFVQIGTWIIQNVVPAVVALYTNIAQGLASALDTIKAKIEENKPQLEQLWSWFKTIAEFVLDNVVPILATYLKTALEVAGIAIGVVIDTIGYLVTAAEWMGTAVPAAVDWVKNAFTSARDWASEKINEITGFFTGLPAAIRGVGADLLSAGSEIITKLFDGMKSAAGGVGQLARDIGQAIKEGINSLLHLPIRIPEIDTHIPGVGTVGGQTLLPAFYNGGILPEGWATVGERGPELVHSSNGRTEVFSNSKSQSMLGGGDEMMGGRDRRSAPVHVELGGEFGRVLLSMLQKAARTNGQVLLG